MRRAGCDLSAPVTLSASTPLSGIILLLLRLEWIFFVGYTGSLCDSHIPEMLPGMRCVQYLNLSQKRGVIAQAARIYIRPPKRRDWSQGPDCTSGVVRNR